jgi:hypothetical protein
MGFARDTIIGRSVCVRESSFERDTLEETTLRKSESYEILPSLVPPLTHVPIFLFFGGEP